MSESNKQVETKVNSAINTFNLVSQTIFTQIINNKPVLKLFSHANNSNVIIKNNTRDSLYQMLLPTYKYLVRLNIKQLHFHLPNNESFLRFHRPNKFGDNLSNIRYSVKMANKEKVVYTGFEEGRIYNGFRYVFPLSYQRQHIGTVETSFSYEAINYQLKLLGIYYSTIALKKEIVDEKVFEDEQKNYEESVFSEDYVLEKKFSHYNNDEGKSFRRIDIEIKNTYADR
ncbi:MAG: two-component sensor histidine kinase, partial [Bacteroidales bacterium]|nr:two-component sensor histidine kinase [Bacteroidales bacterium]